MAGLDKNRRRSRGSRGWLILLTLGVLMLGLLWALGPRVKRGLVEIARSMAPEPKIEEKIVYKDRIVEKIVEKKVEVEVIREVPVQPSLPEKHVPYKSIDMASLYNGFEIKSEMETSEGRRASLERKDDESCLIEFKLKIRVPEPNDTMEDLAFLNSHLPEMLPDLPAMVENGKVSGFYHRLYKLKTKRMQTNLTRLNKILSRHNYYDCDTVMELQHPESGQRVLLIQGDMDVVSDGSDGDRMPEYDEYIAKSQHYQPFTSYGWAKVTDQPNPLLQPWKNRLKANLEALKNKDVSASRKAYIRKVIADEIRPGIRDMEKRSFLIARIDPFMVIPLSFLHYQKKTPFGPTVGDYAAVIYENKIYPAIIGDAGPSFKVGESSLRIAQEIDPRSSPYRRPVNDLTVTYVVFPQSRDKPFTAPDLKEWRTRCAALIDSIGGLGEGYELHEWEDLLAKKHEQEEAGAEDETVVEPSDKASE